MKSLGICIGASSISFVGLNEENNFIKEIYQKTQFHEGNSKGLLETMLNEINLDEYDRICTTGRNFRKTVNLSTITEPESIEYAMQELIKDKNKHTALISAGGETILVYELNKDMHIQNVFTGNKCASGTGSFLLQQLERMGLKIEDLETHSSDSIYELSGRCSVFCKSDCTHALNKGVQKNKVIEGLCKMMAIKITELLSSMKTKNIILTGGISEVKPIVNYIRESVDSLIIPKQSRYFEAYGAALWALKNETIKYKKNEHLFMKKKSSFSFLESLKNSEHLVEFKNISNQKAKNGDICYLGVDVGSTTTKAVLMRKDDDAILASIYLRTKGDPIGAAQSCYKEILKQLGNTKVIIKGLGTTGSGRYITGIHAMTDSIYNEIICHATASIYFDKDVDTIFEIGGQDAKYTYITQGIPSDYAMNEACSAGTGSFLEEAAKESLNVNMEEISDIALSAENPPNFNDQCSAFISSDIATAFQDGLERNDIIAGLVYSVCMNYNNRVRGARPYGKKILMQGGVCYNKSVPIAMASLLKAKIVVPPEPGLMGAFGCALEIKKRVDKKFLDEKEFNLEALIDRQIKYLNPFVCQGGAEKCDRKCQINMLEIENKKIPFGGACNKYYNEIHNIKSQPEKYDFVALREKLLFEDLVVPSGNVKDCAKTIGINKTFLTNMLYPLYFNFWDQLGFKVILSDDVTVKGREKKKSSFCFPAEIAHGAFDNLLSKNPDYIFMPQITHIPVAGIEEDNKACVFVQGEAFYLKEAYNDIKLPKLLIPVIDFQSHVDSTEEEFIKSAQSIGVKKNDAKKAFKFANKKMDEYYLRAWEIGKSVINDLEKNPDEFGIVLLGRWYNALAKEANMSIPHKFATRKIRVIPFDFIPFTNEPLDVHMHWGIGKIILQVTRYIKKHDQLFATYVTNFSCGPDSFIISYFRDTLDKKPSLTLELDSHTADVGLNTRIEAAIDIIRYYRELSVHEEIKEEPFTPSKIEFKGKNGYITDSSGKEWNIKDPSVTFLFPMMGRFLTEGGVAAVTGEGYNSKMVDMPNVDSLRIGKANSNCKECLPYIVMVGSLLEYIQKYKKTDEKIVFFIVGDLSPCRVEQYRVGFQRVVEKNKLKDVAILSLLPREGFSELGFKPLMNIWIAFCLADVIEQVYSATMALAKNRETALELFESEWEKVLNNFRGYEKGVSIYKRLKLMTKALQTIELKKPISEAHRISITGELYVRNEVFCRQKIENTLADMGFISKIAPLIDYLYYLDYISYKNYEKSKSSYFKRFYFLMKRMVELGMEKKIKKIFAKSGLFEYSLIDIKDILDTSKSLVSKHLIGDVGVTVGIGLSEIVRDSCGIITLGPFACVQTRMSEAILNRNMVLDKKILANKKTVFGKNIDKMDQNIPLPYLAIESDGNPFPQLIEARLEVFAMQANRIGDMMNKAK